jgi:hypothetical protein
MMTLKFLNHPNIIKIINFGIGNVVKPKGKIKQIWFMVLELAKGGVLFDFIA